MKKHINRNKIYTIINTDFETLRIYPESGYTVWERYDPQNDRTGWFAFRTDAVQDFIEDCIVEPDPDDEISEDGIAFDTDRITAELEQRIDDDWCNIMHTETNPDSPEAYRIDKDHVDENFPEPGYYIYLPGEGTFKTSEEIDPYYLYYDECEGTKYFSEGFSKPPESLDRFIIDFDNDEYNNY